MSTALDQILESIDPARTLDATSARVDDAVNSFQFGEATLSDWGAYKRQLIDFMEHVEAAVLRLPAMPDCSLDFAWGRCVRLLVKEYGANGEKAAFEMVRTGNEGGLYAVLRRLARRIALHYGGNEVSARISTWWNNLAVNEQIAAAEEYVEKYGHLLPSELIEGGAIRVKVNFPKVLQTHVRMLERLGRVGR